jgi:muconate cycloisomerase
MQTSSEKGPMIVKIELTPVHVPFREFVRQTMESGTGGLGMAIPTEEPWTGGDFVICKLFAEDGSVGLGEAFVWLAETGISPEQIIDLVRSSLKRYILGESPFNIERIRFRMDSNVIRSDVAKGMLDIACYDLMGKITGRQASDFMGGRIIDEVPLCAMVPLMDMDFMVSFAKAFCDGGNKSLRVKLGNSISEDVKIISLIREAVGPDIRLRVDYNQAYSSAMAVRAIKAIEPFGIDAAEQPTRAVDWVGLAYVQKRVDTPLMCHEGCFSLSDMVTLVEMGAVGVLGINAERPGGVTAALRAIDYAALRGLNAFIHNQSLGIGSAMQLNLAATRHNSLGHDTDLFGHVMMEDDLITEDINYDGGSANLPDGPGWGVELDEDALSKYQTADTVKIEA